jgi:hypothetical protein
MVMEIPQLLRLVTLSALAMAVVMCILWVAMGCFARAQCMIMYAMQKLVCWKRTRKIMAQCAQQVCVEPLDIVEMLAIMKTKNRRLQVVTLYPSIKCNKFSKRATLSVTRHDRFLLPQQAKPCVKGAESHLPEQCVSLKAGKKSLCRDAYG